MKLSKLQFIETQNASGAASKPHPTIILQVYFLESRRFWLY